MPSHDARGRIAHRKIELVDEMVVQRGGLGQPALEPVRRLVEGAAAAAIGAAADRQRLERRSLDTGGVGLLVLEDIAEIGAEPRLHALSRVEAFGAGKPVWIGLVRIVGAIGTDRRIARLVTLQQRIALEFVLDEGLQFEMRQLQ